MSDNRSKQNIRRTGRNIWIAVGILAILVIITLALIAAYLSGLSDRDRHIIPLFYEGEREIVRKKGLSYIEVEGSPELVAEDEDARWEVNTSVDLFKNAYANDRGEITVESADGGKVIAPGTGHAYEFSLKNTGNVSLDYALRLGSVFSLSNRELPVRVRLRSGDRWVPGEGDGWIHPDELSDVEETGTVDVNQYVTYTFEWQWPYESGVDDVQILNDLNDTVIGNTAVKQEVTFRLDIQVEATTTPGKAAVDREGKEILKSLTLWNVLTWVVFPGIGLLILLLLFWRTPVYVTGFLPGVGELSLGRKKDTLAPDGRFVFPKVYMGKRKLTLGQSEYRIRLKRKRKLPGIAFEQKDDLPVITLGRRVRAVELYLLPTLAVRQEQWAAIDKDHNVITPMGVKEPDENKENTTPGGLHISKNGSLEIKQRIAVK